MNTIFKVVWSASKQCYVVASELATNTSGKKKIMVATVLAALAMGSFLQVGAETTVTADQVNAINIETNYIKLDSRDIVTKLSSNEFSMIGDDISGIPWKTVLNPGLVAVETSEINTSISRHGFHMSDVDETSETYIEPKGITLGAKDGKILEFNLDKISAGGMKVQDIAEGTADTDAVNVKQLKDSISNISNVAVDAAGIELGYKADGANAQTTSLKDGLNFKSGELTTATVGENGEVTYNVKTSTLTIDSKGTVKGEAGVAISDNVAKVINQVVQQTSSDTKELKQAISNVSTESQRVGAHAAAMAALKPIQYDPLEPTQVMAGVGNYRGETAAALGLAHYTNENTMLNVGVSLGSHNMVNAGITHKFGYSPEKKNIPDRYKGGPISSIYVMQDEMTRMQAKNDAQQVEIEQQRAEIESLKSMVQQLLAKH